MTKRVFRGIFLTSLLILLVCLIFTMGLLYDYYNGRLGDEQAAKAAYIAAGVEQMGQDYFKVMDKAEDRVTLIAADGTVLYDNEADAKTMENHSDREEFQEALKNGVGRATHHSNTLSQKTDYYALRLENGQVLRVATDTFTVWALLLCLLQPLCVIVMLAVVLSAVLASRISKAIVKPINEMNLDAPDIDESYEELGPLLRKINAQNRRIEHQMDELRRRQKEFEVIADNMSEGLLILDSKTEILSANRSVSRFFDVPGELRGQSALVLNRSEPFRRMVNDVLDGHHADFMAPVGGRSYEMIANPVFGADGETAGAVVLIVDVTEREARERLRREFTANVSHELKTPLTSIYGISDMLMSGMVKSEDVAGFAGDIHREADRLIRLVGDIIKLSQLDEDLPAFPKEPVDLYQTAADVIERLRSVAVSRSISMGLSGEHRTINGSSDLLHEMLYNLCDNAIKYNRDGGSVSVTVEGLPDGGTRVRVQDTGIGIPHEHLDRVFERFYRVDKSHSKQIGGTGLGLSIVKHVALYHGGQVAIDSTVGEGTTITVTFPQ